LRVGAAPQLRRASNAHVDRGILGEAPPLEDNAIATENRRTFVTGLVAGLAAPLAAVAQSAMKMPRIDVLLTLYSSAAEDAPQAFRQSLDALGYVDARSAYSAPHLLFL